MQVDFYENYVYNQINSQDMWLTNSYLALKKYDLTTVYWYATFKTDGPAHLLLNTRLLYYEQNRHSNFLHL